MTAIRFLLFWPGLSSAWDRGSARGLLVAVLFSWAVCLVLLATFVWPEWLSGWFLRALVTAIAVCWLVGFFKSRFSPAFASDADEGPQRFSEAQREYLKGNWFEAEALLAEILRENPSDIAAGLIYVGVLRHTERSESALKRLDQLCLYDAADEWRFEIQQEKRLITRQRVSHSQAPIDPRDQTSEVENAQVSMQHD